MLFRSLGRLAYAPGVDDDVEPDGPIGMIYGDLIEYLSRTHEVIPFAYDWRRPVEEEAQRLGRAVDAALNARNASGQPVRILAHSMGNWVTLEALRQMSIRNKGLPPKIQNIMLAAPDVDFDVFRRQILTMEAKPSLFTVFISHDDEALAMSRRMWGNKPRLGAIDADAEPYRDQLSKEKITIVDLTNVESDDRLGHGKFAQSPAVVRSIGARLAAGQTLSDGHAGVGQKLGLATAGAVSTVGAAAGVAVATPFAIVDPNTRDNLGDHIQSVGEPLQSVGDHLRAR